MIRPYNKKDGASVEAICIATASAELVTSEKMRKQTILLYSHYYTRAESEHCFVVTNPSNLVVGYVLCAPNYERYRHEFLAQEQKWLKELSLHAEMRCWGEVRAQKPYAKRYPAHLHIDLLPEYQHLGWGTKLLDTLVEHLGKLHVQGVMLMVDKTNTNAIAFYEKYGFKKLSSRGCIVFGLEI